MGQSTFNLSQFFNRLGIKNPRPTMLESVQPVLVVSDLSEMTPWIRAPSAMVGFDVAGVIAERGFIQIFARGAGGTLVRTITGSDVFFLSTQQPDLGGTEAGIICVFGDVDPVSVVKIGTTAVNPWAGGTAGRYASATRPNFSISNGPIYLAPGQILTVGKSTLDSPLNNYNVWFTDLPAAQLGP